MLNECRFLFLCICSLGILVGFSFGFLFRFGVGLLFFKVGWFRSRLCFGKYFFVVLGTYLLFRIGTGCGFGL